ncbi:MAG TPA: ABC transporter substrate-binding protein [Streptosporangiaceae bacterium]
MRAGPAPQGRSRSRARARLLAAGMTALAMVAAGCSSSGGGSSSAGGTPVKGGTAVWAEPPSATPSYIFPYMNSAKFSNLNRFDFQYQMYRPLYWFGSGDQPTVNYTLSLAYPPRLNGTKVTIMLKHYMWSNGTQVTAQNVIFWLNMELAEPTSYGAYTGFPANVSNIKAVSPTELTMTMNKPYNLNWFQYNDLSQVTPMPAAWDRTASGPSSCTTTVKDCTAVYNYLAALSKNPSGYVTSPIWRIVDGPWKLSAFNADGHVTFVPNKSYSGPVKPSLAQFQEVPFTTDTAEYGVLQSPSASGKVNVGYIPTQDLPAKPANAVVGANPLASKGYDMHPLPVWGINYYVQNLQSTTANGPVIKQLYFRQAMAYLMNQEAVIKGPLKGYGSITVGPVASAPVTQFLSPTGKQGDPFPYNPTKAKSLLTSHGWNVVPQGQTTCTTPSLCGPGVKAGQALKFNFPYATGTAWIVSELSQLQSNAAALGIKLNLEPKPFNQVTALAAGNCIVAKIPCNWDMADWGGGWSFAPDYLPTGETLFKCGAIANSGGFCDKTNDGLIDNTLTSNASSAMYSWQDYLATKLPLSWQPNADYAVYEISSNLKGVWPLSPTLTFTPENWYFTK